ncbi:hypothetical protein TNCV_3218611 [Trichonephila clavipes]|nr:hypothetical protein TNCV_3218611 [Trichonephila clavipes]
MTSHNLLGDSLRWRTIGRLEAGQSQAEVALYLQVARKGSLTYGINSKHKWYCHQQGRLRVSTSAQDRYLTCNCRAGDWPLSQASGASLLLYPAGKISDCRIENISCGHHENRGAFFSVKSQNVPYKEILVDVTAVQRRCNRLFTSVRFSVCLVNKRVPLPPSGCVFFTSPHHSDRYIRRTLFFKKKPEMYVYQWSTQGGPGVRTPPQSP